MAKRGAPRVKLARLEARTRVIEGAWKTAFMAFCVAVGFVVVATALPQRRHLEQLEGKLKLAQEQEESVLAEKEYHQVEYRALREDPDFLEIHARDRLDYYREGERVLKFRSE
ncbi:MAG: septum formation initiator family protein [Verrucomicrobiota bacterium]